LVHDALGQLQAIVCRAADVADRFDLVASEAAGVLEGVERGGIAGETSQRCCTSNRVRRPHT
jgi:hypothetical protein